MKKPRTSAPERLFPHLNEIAKRLYTHHAAIMIGSGFSKNAEPHSASSPGFPDWNRLGDLFYEKLHGKEPGSENRYSDVRTIAHKVETTLDRPSLDDTLKDAIPDAYYEPSDLHKNLLSLPWTDVFTTNYDTLLERASSSVSQRYDIIRKQEDLSRSEKPRIIKLHGCISTSGPYTITEEDYHHYPKRYAAFSNTVRQAFLENTICLIGFSGHDQNFHNWVRWLHEVLGRRNTRKIYLIRSLNLPISETKILERLNIETVDMSEYPDIQPDDHKAGLHRFIDYLKEWPSSRGADNSTKGDSELRELDWPTKYDPSVSRTADNKIRERVLDWERERRSYPGWVVAPPDSRQRLWDSTRTWLRYYPTDQLPEFLDLQFAFEMVWRMEKCLFPILDNQIKSIQSTIDKYLATDSADSYESSKVDSTPSQATIQDMCHYLMLAIMRYYRIEGLLDQWNDIQNRLSGRVFCMSPDHRARYYYERALSALFELDLQRLRTILEEWPRDDGLPFWEAKRASLLAEMGSISDAEIILTKSLSTIRSRSFLSGSSASVAASQESIVMILRRSVQIALSVSTRNFGSPPSSKSDQKRWQSLKQYKCDPWSDLERFESILDRTPQYTPYVDRHWSFDIGHISSTHHFLNDGDREILTAYRFLLYCEEAGIPFRIGNFTIATTCAAGTLSRLRDRSPYWTNATLIRIGDDKHVDLVFFRKSIAELPTGDVDRLLEQYMKSLNQASAEISAADSWDTNFGILMSTVLPEIISRLCCRCSRGVKNKLIEFVRGIYLSDNRRKYRRIDHLTYRLVESLSNAEIIDLIPRLLKFPILDDRDYANPLSHVDLQMKYRFSDRSMADNRHLNVYVDGVRSDRLRHRQECILTLGQLYFIGYLNQETTDEFAKALWGTLDEYGLPSGTEEFRRYAVLMLPHPPHYEPIVLFKRWIEKQLVVQANSTSNLLILRNRLPDPKILSDEIAGACNHVKWSPEETVSIIRKLASWWDSEKGYLRSNSHNTRKFQQRFKSLVKVLGAIMDSISGPMEDRYARLTLERLSREFDEHGVPALRFRSSCFHIFPEWRSSVLQRIEDGMKCLSGAIARDSFLAMEIISKSTSMDSPDTKRAEFIHILSIASQAVRWRSEAALEAALGTVAQIVAEHSWLFDDDETIESSLLEGLRYLIEETAFHTQSDRFDETGENRWDTGKRLIVRREAAGLAHVLFQRCQRLGTEPPEVLRSWQSLCQSDMEFAEIRNMWLA